MSENLALFNAILNQKKHISFHTPGHKFNIDDISDLFECDTTELSCTDELYDPSGIILKAEEHAKELFYTDMAFFSASGATLCLQTALSFFAGKRILAERCCHYSILNAAALLNIDIDFISPRFNREFGIASPANVNDLEKAFRKNSFSAIVITSPDYFGVCRNLKSIHEFCKEKGVSLIIDASHGSHLPFMYNDSRNAGLFGDFIIYSVHKTLPVLTGGAVLCVNEPYDRENVKEHFKMFGTSSPSFPILASIDYGLSYINNNRKSYIEEAKKVSGIYRILKEYGYSVLNPARNESLRLCIDTFSIGYRAEEIENILNEKNIYSEIAKDNILVLLFSPLNGDGDIELLIKTLTSVRKRKKIEKKDMEILFKKPKRILSAREAFLAEKELIETKNASGRISGNTIATCPPGIPVVIAGELIEEDRIDYIKKIKPKIEVVK